MSGELSKAIVRNTENDHDIMLFMKQGVKITNTLREAMVVLEENGLE